MQSIHRICPKSDISCTHITLDRVDTGQAAVVRFGVLALAVIVLIAIAVSIGVFKIHRQNCLEPIWKLIME